MHSKEVKCSRLYISGCCFTICTWNQHDNRFMHLTQFSAIKIIINWTKTCFFWLFSPTWFFSWFQSFWDDETRSATCDFIRLTNACHAGSSNQWLWIGEQATSVERQKGLSTIQGRSVENQNQWRYPCTKYMAIAPFWFSTEHCWAPLNNLNALLVLIRHYSFIVSLFMLSFLTSVFFLLCIALSVWRILLLPVAFLTL